MKKILLTAITALFAMQLNAQVCNKYQPTVVGAKSYILPDSATGIKHACAGKPYDEIMNIKVFKDTTIGGIFTAVVDSVVINLEVATIGLPAGFVISSVPAMLPPNAINNFNHMTLRGDSVGCVRITGIAPTTVGTTALTIPFKIKAKVGGFIDTSVTQANNNYKFIVDAIGTGNCFAASIAETYNNVLDIKALPNPASQSLTINVNAFDNEKVTVTLNNIFGQQVATVNGVLKNGANNFTFNVANFANGVYTYTLSNGKNKVTNKWVKQ